MVVAQFLILFLFPGVLTSCVEDVNCNSTTGVCVYLDKLSLSLPPQTIFLNTYERAKELKYLTEGSCRCQPGYGGEDCTEFITPGLSRNPNCQKLNPFIDDCDCSVGYYGENCDKKCKDGESNWKGIGKKCISVVVDDNERMTFMDTVNSDMRSYIIEDSSLTRKYLFHFEKFSANLSYFSIGFSLVVSLLLFVSLLYEFGDFTKLLTHSMLDLRQLFCLCNPFHTPHRRRFFRRRRRRRGKNEEFPKREILFASDDEEVDDIFRSEGEIDLDDSQEVLLKPRRDPNVFSDRCQAIFLFDTSNFCYLIAFCILLFSNLSFSLYSLLVNLRVMDRIWIFLLYNWISIAKMTAFWSYKFLRDPKVEEIEDDDDQGDQSGNQIVVQVELKKKAKTSTRRRRRSIGIAERCAWYEDFKDFCSGTLICFLISLVLPSIYLVFMVVCSVFSASEIIRLSMSFFQIPFYLCILTMYSVDFVLRFGCFEVSRCLWGKISFRGRFSVCLDTSFSFFLLVLLGMGLAMDVFYTFLMDIWLGYSYINREYFLIVYFMVHPLMNMSLQLALSALTIDYVLRLFRKVVRRLDDF